MPVIPEKMKRRLVWLLLSSVKLVGSDARLLCSSAQRFLCFGWAGGRSGIQEAKRVVATVRRVVMSSTEYRSPICRQNWTEMQSIAALVGMLSSFLGRMRSLMKESWAHGSRQDRRRPSKPLQPDHADHP